MSWAVLIFISFGVFFTSDVVIGGTSDVPGLIFFCRGFGVWRGTILCKSVRRWLSARLSLVNVMVVHLTFDTVLLSCVCVSVRVSV